VTRYGAGNDGCVWNPEKRRAAFNTDEHYQTVRAAVIVGATGEWRLCASCAGLPLFSRKRNRTPIDRTDYDRRHCSEEVMREEGTLP
jgi:hypothetical protein